MNDQILYCTFNEECGMERLNGLLVCLWSSGFGAWHFSP